MIGFLVLRFDLLIRYKDDFFDDNLMKVIFEENVVSLLISFFYGEYN